MEAVRNLIYKPNSLNSRLQTLESLHSQKSIEFKQMNFNYGDSSISVSSDELDTHLHEDYTVKQVLDVYYTDPSSK